MEHELSRTHISLSIKINASAGRIWDVLTKEAEMRQWMGEEELNLRITTSWEEGSGIQMTGFHHEPFVNDGIVLKARKPSELSYTHRSSISNLPEVPSSYCIFTFKLLSLENGSQLQLTIAQFPTESIFLHLQLYWNVTLKFIKVQAEKQTHEQ